VINTIIAMLAIVKTQFCCLVRIECSPLRFLLFDLS
jgi:hypothetical protein